MEKHPPTAEMVLSCSKLEAGPCVQIRQLLPRQLSSLYVVRRKQAELKEVIPCSAVDEPTSNSLESTSCYDVVACKFSYYYPMKAGLGLAGGAWWPADRATKQGHLSLIDQHVFSRAR